MASIAADRCRASGRSPRCSALRAALAEAIGAGLSGPVDFLAEHTGWPPDRVRAAIHEMRRAGEVDSLDAEAAADSTAQGRGRGRPPKIYRAPVRPAPGSFNSRESLAFLQAVWR